MNQQNNTDTLAQILLPSKDLTEDIDFFIKIGFRLDNIFPSDDPAVARMSGHNINIRIDKNANCSPSTIQILTDNPEDINGGKNEFTAPNGTHIVVQPKSYELVTPPTQHKFEVRQLQDSDPWVIGRAGMQYRDLIPDRLGGSIIASHIRIPDGGPVPDMVHYHTLGFQLIFCYSGWVKVVYEDQGPPITLKAGDCVTQPPEIRHRVLEASDNLEVIEIGVPSDHMTTIDHEMALPTEQFNPDREFQGQKFCHHISKETIWNPWRINGFQFRDTGINKATRGVASVHVVQSLNNSFKPQLSSHNSDILFTFVMQGEFVLTAVNQPTKNLKKGDAYVIPPNLKHQIANCSDDLELLEVSLPGDFSTTNY